MRFSPNGFILFLFPVGQHLLIFDSIEKSAKLHRSLAEEEFMAPIVTFSQTDTGTISKWMKHGNLQVSTTYLDQIQCIVDHIVCLSVPLFV